MPQERHVMTKGCPRDILCYNRNIEFNGRDHMKSISFNDHWYVRHAEEPGLGEPVTLPHDAMLSEPRTAIAEGGLNVSLFEGRDYVYAVFFSRSAPLITSAAGRSASIKPRSPSKPAAYPLEPLYSFSMFSLLFP